MVCYGVKEPTTVAPHPINVPIGVDVTSVKTSLNLMKFLKTPSSLINDDS